MPADCRAWVTSCLPYDNTAIATLLPVQLGLDKGGPPPSYSALLALAFGRQDHHPGFLVAHQRWRECPLKGGAECAHTALLRCGAL